MEIRDPDVVRSHNVPAVGAAAEAMRTAGAVFGPPRSVVAILATAAFITCFDNNALWHEVSRLTQGREHVWSVSVAFFAMLLGTLNILLAVAALRRSLKPVLIAVLLLSALLGFFMSEYKIVVDPFMIQSVLETDRREVRDLITPSLVRHVALFGVAPSMLVALVPLVPLGPSGWGKDMAYRAGLVTASLVALVLAVYLAYQDLSVFTQRHRHVRMLMNPGYPIYALVQNIRGMSPQRRSRKALAPAAARRPHASRDRKTLFVLVVGETARADRFALNGYGRETNRYTRALGVTSFSRVASCGTSTAESIPCLFSSLGRAEFSRDRAQGRENLLELLQRLGVDVRWRENNTGCKGVCAGIEMERFGAADGGSCTVANGCYDEVLVADLERLAADPAKDHLLVLHQRGSHGPAYQNNTPAWAKRFSPECTSGQVTECTSAQIDNAYDNTILYSDWILAKVIESLRDWADLYDVAMLYVSDHGESLGEAGIYLHGFPYAIAPEEQIHIPMLFWASDGFYESRRISSACIKEQVDEPLSHDNVFHTIVSVFDVTTDWYRPALDVFAPCAGAARTGAPS